MYSEQSIHFLMIFEIIDSDLSKYSITAALIRGLNYHLIHISILRMKKHEIYEPNPILVISIFEIPEVNSLE